MADHAHTPADAHGHAHAGHDAHPHVNYFAIFIALCICTGISVAFDVYELPKVVLVCGVLAVAVAKALFVMTYFMHLKFEGPWKFIILAPTAILAVGLMVALAPDMAMHYYQNDAPQVHVPNAPVSAEHGAESGHDKSDASDSGHNTPAH